MMKKLLPFFLIILLAGCTHKVYLSLMPDYDSEVVASNELTDISPAIKFVKGDFEDKRAAVSMYASFKQDVHTFNLFAERPVEEAIFDGLAVMIDKSGQSWSESGEGQVKINMQLLSTTATRNAGFVSVGASSAIQIKLDFLNNSTGALLYSQIYNGTDDRSQAMVGLMDMVKKSIDASIINCINQVAGDKNLSTALKK